MVGGDRATEVAERAPEHHHRVLSDNGFLFRAHQLYGKRLPYMESVQVPAMIRWSGHIPADSVWKRPVA